MKQAIFPGLIFLFFAQPFFELAWFLYVCVHICVCIYMSLILVPAEFLMAFFFSEVPGVQLISLVARTPANPFFFMQSVPSPDKACYIYDKIDFRNSRTMYVKRTKYFLFLLFFSFVISKPVRVKKSRLLI